MVYSQSIELFSARSDGMGKTVSLFDPTTNGIFISGVGLSHTDRFVLEAGYKRQYDLKDLDILNSSIAYRSDNVTIAGGFMQFGDPDLYTEKLMQFGLIYTFSKFGLGSFIKTTHHDFNNYYSSKRTYALAISGYYKFARAIVGAKIDNIKTDSYSQNFKESHRVYDIHAEYLFSEFHATTFRIILQNESKSSIGIGERIKLSDAASLMFGYSTNPKKFGAGIELFQNKNSFVYTSSYHAELGMTHTISFVIRQ